MNKGFEFAFKGAMNAYGILANKVVLWIGHVTGTGGESVAHYWPESCETCKEINEFISGWSPEHEPKVNPENRISLACWKCGHVCYVNPETEQFCPHCGTKAIQTLSFE